MSKEKPPSLKTMNKGGNFYVFLRSYLFVVFQDRIASVMLAQE